MARIAGVLAVSIFSPTMAFVMPSVKDIGQGPQSIPEVVPQSISAQVPGININESGCFASTSLLVGLALGLVVGFAGAVAPAAAAEETALPVQCKRLEGCMGDVMEKWFKRELNRLDSPMVANKHTIATTGSGRYRLFGLDFASPIPSIPDTTDGKYQLRTARRIKGPLGKEIKYDQGYAAAGPRPDVVGQEAEAKALIERVKPFMGKNATATNTFSPFAPFDWGKTNWELDGITVDTKAVVAGG